MRNNNLRRAASSFVGRASDAAAIEARLDEGRLVTIVGPGGMGKTRLALRFAEEHVAAFSEHDGGGVWFCDVSEARDLGDVVSAVAAALETKLDSVGSEATISEALGAAIARRGRVLIVIDNFDRLVDHAPLTVGTWLAAAPSARFLVTSRVPLDLVGEQLWSLSPLSREEAVELFVRRARQIRPNFVPPDDGTLDEIVLAIDRMPLAIELAATRVAVLSASQLRARLDSPLDVLAGRRSTGRHASMRRTILDSVELLAPTTQRVFAACALLRNGFSLEAAEALLADDVVERGEVLGEIESLVRASLLRVRVEETEDVARYAFFETIRDVADELAIEWPAAMRLRHVAHYADVARRARGVAALAPDLENLLEAHRVAVSIGSPHALSIALGVLPLLSARGLSGTCARLFDEALAIEGAPGPARAEGILARGLARRELGETDVARADFELGLSIARAEGLPAIAAIALTRLGEMSDLAGDTRSARARFEEALALLAGAPEDEERALREAEAHLRLGHALRREGELSRAREALLVAVDRYRSHEGDEGLAWAMYELAVIEMFGGATEQAFARFDEGLRVAERGLVRVVTGALKTARGCLLQDTGRLDEALQHHAEAARVFHEHGSRYREASALYYLATTYLERGEAGEAESILRTVRDRLRGVGAARYDALMEGCLASTLAAQGRPKDAAAAIARAESALALVRNEPALASNVRIHRLNLTWLTERGDPSEPVAEAEALVRASPTDDSRFALRVLLQSTRGERPHHEALVVWPDGSAFRLPGAEVVSLPEKSPLRRVLALFAERRIDSPGRVTTIEEVIRAGWPSERIAAEAALNRAHVALASLRKLGLRGVLVHEAGGYLISQAIAVRRAE